MASIYQTSAPGSIMLFGEHAVLHGHLAIACAVNQRITILLKPSLDKNIRIISDSLGNYHSQLNAITIEKPFNFLLAAIKRYQPELPSGFTLEITSEFSHQVGLGSSAASTIAGVSVLNHWLGRQLSKMELFQEAFNIIQTVQGAGSGTDVAASIFGGIIAYRQKPFFLQGLTQNIPISLVYAGYKTSTAEVIHKVSLAAQQFPEIYASLFHSIGACSETAMTALQQNDQAKIGRLFFIQQQLMQALGVADPTLRRIIDIVKNDPEVINAKISGSGLGDCVVVLGKISENTQQKLQQIPNSQIISVEISDQGIIYASE